MIVNDFHGVSEICQTLTQFQNLISSTVLYKQHNEIYMFTSTEANVMELTEADVMEWAPSG